jgi:hypothetical protein
MMRLETPERQMETPERDLTRLPRHPGPGARPVICSGRAGTCRKLLGIADGAYLFVNNDGREIEHGRSWATPPSGASPRSSSILLIRPALISSCGKEIHISGWKY